MADAAQSRPASLAVPGATLYYQTKGKGPLLLMLQGGDGDADGTDALAGHLVNRYTVLTYDRRGLSRSPIDFFLTHDASAARRYHLDMPAIHAAARRIVPAAGDNPENQGFPRHCAQALAKALGRPLVAFPGGHNGFMLRPRGFAARLQEVLTESRIEVEPVSDAPAEPARDQPPGASSLPGQRIEP
jgi:pimeloyl-ACP methyl ester carboxylesterase